MTAVRPRPQSWAATATTPARRTGWRGVATPLLAWFSSRVLVLLSIAVGNAVRDDGRGVIEALHLWDGNWYLSAAAGYEYPDLAVADLDQVNIAFFPLYPLLIRAARFVTGWTPLAAALLVSLVFGALALVAMWLLVDRISGREVADRSVMLLAFAPGALVLSLVYSEGVMLTLAAGCLLALVSRRWVAAGVLAALASAARPTGVALLLACGVAALLQLHRGGDRRAVVAPLLAPLGIAAYLGWLWFATGSATVWFRVQREGWGEVVDFGRRTIADLEWIGSLVAGLDYRLVPMSVQLRLGGLLFLVVAVALMVWWRPPATLWAYTAGVLGPSLLSHTLGARPRFLFTAFPLIVAVAWAARGAWYHAVLGTSAVSLALTTIIYTTPGVVAP